MMHWWRYGIMLGMLVGPAWAAAYFQQYVKYDIDVRLDPELVRLEGKQRLLYVNHSPDTLRELYFHLYFNKYRSDSYFPSNRGRTSAYTEVLEIRLADSTLLDFSVDHTILHLPLQPFPLLPGDSLELYIDFVSVLPPSQSRYGYSGDHYDVGNWYPIPAVYDHLGWHTEQHMDGEFYHEWGDYDVRITVPSYLVVTATGELMNPEVLPDSLDYPDRSFPLLNYDEMDTVTVTYHFRARRVHDFAWSADPEFVRVRRQVDGVNLDFYVLAYRLEKWREAVEAGVRAFRFFTEKIGPYPYPNLSIVDGFIRAGGIEYPNLVIINDLITDIRFLSIVVIHEIAHQWFYGMLANNQTRYGWMDEGFTTFFEILATEHIWGSEDNLSHRPAASLWRRLLGYRKSARRNLFRSYFEYSLQGKEEPINTHFDYFQNNPYVPYYDKTAAVLFALKEMLGDSLFFQAVREYYQRWRFRHPYPQDLFVSFEQSTGMELDWFWEEWLNSTWRCDYQLDDVSGHWRMWGDSLMYQITVRLQRKEPAAMPIWLRVELSDGRRYRYRIPVAGWLRGKHQPYDLPAWHMANRKYRVDIRFPEKVKFVEIESGWTNMDYNPFNNSSRKLPPIRWYWMRRQYRAPHLDAYTVTVFPYAFYNEVDGIRLGWRTVGNFLYPYYVHNSEFLWGIRSLRPSLMVNWSSPVRTGNNDFTYHVQFYHTDGRAGAALFFQNAKEVPRKLYRRLSFGWEWQTLTDARYVNVDEPEVRSPGTSRSQGMVPADSWSEGDESSFFVEWRQTRFLRWRWKLYANRLRLTLRSSTLGSDFAFQKLEFDIKQRFPFFLDLDAALLLRLGKAWGEVPLQHRFFLAQASPYRRFASPFYRSRGTIPGSWERKGWVYFPGGGDIHSALRNPRKRAFSSTGLLAVGGQLEFWNPFAVWGENLPILPNVRVHLFGRWAQVRENPFQWQDAAMEAGIQLGYFRIPVWLRYLSFSGITLELPLWSNQYPAGESALDLRWVFTISSRMFQ